MKVRSDGYYRFFPGDYRRDTSDLSLVEDGAYRRLLDHYYSMEELPSDFGRLCRICGAMTDEEKEAVKAVAGRFFRKEDGRLINDRAEREIEARRVFLEEQSRKGKLSAEARRNTNRGSNPGSTAVQPRYEPKSNQASASVLASEFNKDQNQKPSCPKSAPSDAAIAVSKHLAGKILENNPGNRELQNGARDKTIQRWALEVDRMIRIDKRNPEQIRMVIDWSQKDEFWKCNILSAPALRKKFDQLWVKINGSSKEDQDIEMGYEFLRGGKSVMEAERPLRRPKQPEG